MSDPMAYPPAPEPASEHVEEPAPEVEDAHTVDIGTAPVVGGESSESVERTGVAEGVEDGSPDHVDEPSSSGEAGSELPDDESRRGRNGLEADVKTVTDLFVSGEFTLTEGEHLTPHRISRKIQALDNLDKAPSVGAIQNVLKRWAEIGFAELTEDKPLGFLKYTDDAYSVGLEGLRQAARERRKAEKARAREAAKGAEAGLSDAAGDGGDSTSTSDDELPDQLA